MPDGALEVLTFAAALGCGLAAGAFFAFSTFVMPALARLPSAQGIAAMQAINVAAITPMFMTALFGTGAACAVLLVSAVVQRPGGAACLIAGSILYLAGTILVTIVCHVPRNNALAALDPAAPDAAARWAEYVAGWTAWNHVRTAAALGGAALLMLRGWP
jgi:uncharacterized membrane protein